jgi:hypothetical protein
MFVADNEDEILRLYPRFPTTSCAGPAYSFNARPYLALSSSNPEADPRPGCVDDANGTRLYWLAPATQKRATAQSPAPLRHPVTGTAPARPLRIELRGTL